MPSTTTTRPPLLEIAKRIATETGRDLDDVTSDILLGVLLVAPDIQFVRGKGGTASVAACAAETVIG